MPTPHRLLRAAAWLLLPMPLAALSAPPAPTARLATSAAAKSAPAAAPAPASALQSDLDALRERLAEKLGAAKSVEPKSPNLLRVTARVDAAAAETPNASAKKAAKPPPPEPAGQETTAAKHAVRWAYAGETGPAAWGGLRPEFTACARGQRQSPIDIRGGIAVELDPVQFDYRPSTFGVIDNGHTVQANVAPGNTIQVMGRRYELVQFHFHRPSEERIDGRQFEMDVHLVHKDPEGRLAVVAVLLERGAAQPVVQAVWNNLPLEKGEEQPAAALLDISQLLPADRGYYTYMGSLTTPPCTEGVTWMVMRQPVTVSPAQLDIFARLYPMNARPVQSASGRLIKQSQ